MPAVRDEDRIARRAGGAVIARLHALPGVPSRKADITRTWPKVPFEQVISARLRHDTTDSSP
ncbi:MAG TPA: hypothetical protein DHU96_10030 [Actinobacteria bacterium]|nr:hypothetical protein [Actinomycetota bacterium]